MARTDNLTNYLTDVAQAIKDKKGDQTNIKASEFDTEIANLSSGGGDIEEYISSTSDNKEVGKTISIGEQIQNRIKKLPELDLSDINDSNVLSYLFNGLKKINSLPIIKINDSIEKISLRNTFSNCENLINLSNIINTIKNKKIINLYSTFFQCSKIIDISFLNEVDTSENTFLQQTFQNCYELENIPQFNTQNVTTMQQCFQECKKIKTIPQFNTAKCTSFQNLFNNANNLTSLPKLNYSSAIDIFNMLNGTKSNLIDLGGFENLGFMYTSKSANYLYYKLDLSYCPALTKQSVLNVFENLADLNNTYPGEAVTQQIVLHPDVHALLEADDLAIATTKGWNIITQSH